MVTCKGVWYLCKEKVTKTINGKTNGKITRVKEPGTITYSNKIPVENLLATKET